MTPTETNPRRKVMNSEPLKIIARVAISAAIGAALVSAAYKVAAQPAIPAGVPTINGQLAPGIVWTNGRTSGGTVSGPGASLDLYTFRPTSDLPYQLNNNAGYAMAGFAAVSIGTMTGPVGQSVGGLIGGGLGIAAGQAGNPGRVQTPTISTYTPSISGATTIWINPPAVVPPKKRGD